MRTVAFIIGLQISNALFAIAEGLGGKIDPTPSSVITAVSIILIGAVFMDVLEFLHNLERK